MVYIMYTPFSTALPSLTILDTPLKEEKHVIKLCQLLSLRFDISDKNQQTNWK